MTDQWDFNNDGGFENEQTPKGLRSWAKSVQDENKALKDQLAEISADLKRQKLTNVFEDLGLPRQAAGLYTGEADPEKVKEWATTMQTIFGTSGAPLANQPGSTAPAIDAQQASDLQKFTEAGANAQPSTSIDDYQRGVNQAASPADLVALFAQMNGRV